jgi:hypothetical protein
MVEVNLKIRGRATGVLEMSPRATLAWFGNVRIIVRQNAVRRDDPRQEPTNRFGGRASCDQARAVAIAQ